ncbi:MAG: septum formation initiator family protein [Elusimicrobia bacterium]|nr:septum formation initiator family protein [Elusimicrobiota bacterium]
MLKKRRILFYGIVVAVLLFLLANAGFRTMVRRYGEIHKLKTDIAFFKRENMYLTREVYYLEHDASYIEHMARRELGLVSSGEIEYRFKKK